MNTIDDSIQKIKDDLDAIAECVTTRVLTGLQQPEGLLFKQDAKIDLIQAQLMRLLPLVEQSLCLPPNGNCPLSDDESDSPSKKSKLDNTLPMEVAVVRAS
jgi:hypothetical protein